MNINIDIPDEVRVYVEAQVIADTYSSKARIFSGFGAARPKTQGTSVVRSTFA